MDRQEHQGIPPTCGCTDYGVHRALHKLDHESRAGRYAAEELGGLYRRDYDRRVKAAKKELDREIFLSKQPGRINPTPGYLRAKVETTLRKYGYYSNGPSFLSRLRAAVVAFCWPG
jgi:hypothetical protein